MVSRKKRLKVVYPMTCIGVAAVLLLTILGLDTTHYWEAYPLGFYFVAMIVMANAIVIALIPISIVQRTERFLIGPRRTHWKLDETVTVAPGSFWSYLIHIPKDRWIGVRCDSESPLTVEVVSEAVLGRGPNDRSWKPEEARRNVRSAVLTYSAEKEGDWMVVVRNDSQHPHDAHVRVSEWLGTGF